MFDNLRDLYQEVIFDHNRNPRNFRQIANPTHKVAGFNPLCGDRITLFLQVENDKIIDASFQGEGCAISTASVSLMTDLIKGKTCTEAQEIFQQFLHLVTGNGAHDTTKVGKLAVLAGVRQYPARVKCATLAWHTLGSALQGNSAPVSTE